MKLRPTRDDDERLLVLLRERARREKLAEIARNAQAVRERCSTLHGFIEEFWQVLEPVAEFKTGWALRTMCDHLEAVTRGDIKRLLITVPPGMMKSLLMVFWTAWEWGPKAMPHIQVLATSYSQKNAFRDNQKLRDLVSSDEYQALWTIELRTDTNAISKFANTKSGWCEARPFSKMTGGRANRVKVDDPHDTEGAESDVQRKTTVRILREAISDRLNDVTRDAIVLIMQRLHHEDCAAAAKAMGFVHLELPMEFEPGRRCTTVLRPANDSGLAAIIFEDPRQVEGELLFPERFPASAVAQLKSDKGSYAWAGQYQQRPTPREGGMFKRGWFKMAGALPLGCRRYARGWDFGASEGNTADYTAGVKITRDGPEGAFYIVHAKRGRWSPGNVETEVIGTADSDAILHPGAITIRVPQDPGAAGKAYVRTLVLKLARHAVKFEPVTGSKEVRARALAVQAEVGNVYILQTGDPEKDAWIKDFLDELEVFPSGAHDDQVDAASDAFNEVALAPPPMTATPMRR